MEHRKGTAEIILRRAFNREDIAIVVAAQPEDYQGPGVEDYQEEADVVTEETVS